MFGTIAAESQRLINDLGPGAGHDGGRIVFEGTPADLVKAKSTLTGEHLPAFVGGRQTAARSRNFTSATRD
jgi:excinuclease UvrABC ATPase subunit